MSVILPVQGSSCVRSWWPHLLDTHVSRSACSEISVCQKLVATPIYTHVNHSACSGIRVCQKLVATPAMQSVGAEATDPPSKLCGKHRFDTDDYWACMVRRNALTNYHPCGTCKMGPTNDKSTVVDPQLRYSVVEENTLIGRCFVKIILWGAPARTTHFLSLFSPKSPL